MLPSIQGKNNDTLVEGKHGKSVPAGLILQPARKIINRN
jgi:hypothetical protein